MDTRTAFDGMIEWEKRAIRNYFAERHDPKWTLAEAREQVRIARNQINVLRKVRDSLV